MGPPTAAAGQGLAARSLLCDHRIRWVEAIPWAFAIAVFFVFPGYRLLATQILVLILFALSLDLIVGYTGIVSLGHTAYFGTGAYTAALLASNGWTEPLSGLAAALVLGALFGLVTGWVVLRTHGLTLLMLTMAATIMLYELAKDLDFITGGFDGINFQNDPILGVLPFDVVWYSSNYWYALFFLFAFFWLARSIVYSPFGKALIGIRENAARMHAIGSPVGRRKLTIYVTSAGIAGVAGAIWVQIQGNITPAVYEFELAAEILIMIILGGTGRLYGAFVGVVAYKVLENVTETILGTDEPYWMLAIGIALVFTVLFARRGLLGILGDARNKLGRAER